MSQSPRPSMAGGPGDRPADSAAQPPRRPAAQRPSGPAAQPSSYPFGPGGGAGQPTGRAQAVGTDENDEPVSSRVLRSLRIQGQPPPPSCCSAPGAPSTMAATIGALPTS